MTKKILEEFASMSTKEKADFIGSLTHLAMYDKLLFKQFYMLIKREKLKGKKLKNVKFEGTFENSKSLPLW